MKRRLLLLSALLPLVAFSQTETQGTIKTDIIPYIGGIAVANPTKDTIFVCQGMLSQALVDLWNDKPDGPKPVFKELNAYDLVKKYQSYSMYRFTTVSSR